MSSNQTDPPRNRKRILDPSEINEEEGSSRRGPNWDWHETLRSMGVPNKKGFSGNESQYKDLIDQGLADNFEDSLSGLGVDISTVTGTYNMSEAIMALPNVSVFKNESLDKSLSLDSHHYDDNSQSNTTDRLFRLLSPDSFNQDSPGPSIHQLLHHHLNYPDQISSVSDDKPLLISHGVVNEIGDENGSHLSLKDSTLSESSLSHHHPFPAYENNKFQYVLAAATSVAVQVNEESLTYLNQGQSYEIKIKKLGDITRCQGKFYHTKIRICFHERRLQYMEKEQLENWKQTRPGERIMEIDVPLSYGISDVVQNPLTSNQCEFDWEPSKEIGVYVKVNCISTEFTPKKHGGEKGVPFRIQIETLVQNENGYESLYACACQIKVFKLKGADRKHKQDKEKISKKAAFEADKYQKQCDCTILQEIPIDTLYVPSYKDDSPSRNQPLPIVKHIPTSSPTETKTTFNGAINSRILSSSSLSSELENSFVGKTLDTNSTNEEAQLWLTANRFNSLVATFENFSGTDLLRLTRAELIEICGLLDGIRLYNGLHSKTISPRLTIYVRVDADQPYHAIFLKDLTVVELVQKMTDILKISESIVQECFTLGPNGVQVMMSDAIIRNWENESIYNAEILSNNKFYKFLFQRQLTFPPTIPSSTSS